MYTYYKKEGNYYIINRQTGQIAFDWILRTEKDVKKKIKELRVEYIYTYWIEAYNLLVDSLNKKV